MTWPPVEFGTVEAIALGTSERDVLRMTFDVSAVNDLYLLGRRTDRILLLLKMRHVLIDSGASAKCEDRN